jgi:hemerythrin
MHSEEKKGKIRPAMLEHNVFIVWKPDYNLGIPIVDEQHRGIVSTINSLHFVMQNSYTKDMLVPIIDMMNDYTRIHFGIEEAFLERIDYPNAKRHHELHDVLSIKLMSIGKSSIFDRDPYPFMEFLKNWWIDHICNEDLIFRNYLVSSDRK